MESFFISALTVASAEIGDKTQLLALILATRFRQSLPIIFGILVATVLNHSLAAALGEWIGTHLTGNFLHILLASSFLITAVWMLIPDKVESVKQENSSSNLFIATVIAFFLAEMGDKTQIATALMGAQFQAFFPIVLGTTLGMLAANVPVVLLGHKAYKYISISTIRIISASIFFLLVMTEIIKLLR